MKFNNDIEIEIISGEILSFIYVIYAIKSPVLPKIKTSSALNEFPEKTRAAIIQDPIFINSLKEQVNERSAPQCLKVYTKFLDTLDPKIRLLYEI